MRRAAATVAGAAALAGLFLPGALAGASAAYAAQTAVPPKGGCEQPPEKAPNAVAIPWAQKMLKAERIWPISTGKDVTVAVIDSGVDVSHRQLKGADIADGSDFLRGNGGGDGKLDCLGHGTAVASVIAAQKVEGVGFQGLAYDATILPIAVSESPDGEETRADQRTNPAKLVQAIDWAVDHGAQVINLSLMLYADESVVKDAVDRALAEDVVIVAAAGNRAEKLQAGPSPYPASYPGVIGVGAVTDTAGRWKHSQWGEHVDVVAPGEGVVAANRGGGHLRWKGTSFATPFVSAAAALVRSRWPELSAEEVARRLFATASPAGGSPAKAGHGLVDPYRALTEGLTDDPPEDLEAVQKPSPAPEVVARAEEWELSGTISLATAGVGVLLAALMLTTLTLLPLGNRRRWRPGRAKPFPERKEDDMPPAPVKLFEDLET